MENVGITEKTVLVLGAGASMPFGFPSGRKLTEDICQRTGLFGNKSLLEQTGILRDGSCNRPEIIRRWTQGQREKFARDYETFKQALGRSGQPSVDTFLERKRKFADIGKLAIASVLLKSELTYKMFEGMEGRDNWYQHLFKKLDEGGLLESFGQNKLAIVTFNYDRSLEQYLFTALTNSYEETKEECAKAVGKIPIIHVYGSLGLLPWQDKENNTPYDLGTGSTTVKLEQIEKASKTIKIIRDDNDLEGFGKAWIEMQNAKRIYFLGFGFDQTNVNRLKLESLRVGRQIGGTYKGLSKATRDRMEGLCWTVKKETTINKQGERIPVDTEERKLIIDRQVWKDIDVYDFLYNHITL